MSEKTGYHFIKPDRRPAGHRNSLPMIGKVMLTCMLVWIYWLISLTFVTWTSAYIIRRYPRYAFTVLVGFYLVYLTAAQILAARIVEFDLGFIVLYSPASVFIYPFIAQVIDMINEVYGVSMTHIAILVAFGTQVLLVIFFAMVNSLTPAPFFLYETAWQEIFGLGIRITAASWIAFLICSNIDAWVFDRLKKKFIEREKACRCRTIANPWIWLRSSTSDIVNLTLDSVIFVTIAFAGILPLAPLIIGQIITKTVIGFIDNPWFVWYKSLLKNDEEAASVIT